MSWNNYKNKHKLLFEKIQNKLCFFCFAIRDAIKHNEPGLEKFRSFPCYRMYHVQSRVLSENPSKSDLWCQGYSTFSTAQNNQIQRQFNYYIVNLKIITGEFRHYVISPVHCILGLIACTRSGQFIDCLVDLWH